MKRLYILTKKATEDFSFAARPKFMFLPIIGFQLLRFYAEDNILDGACKTDTYISILIRSYIFSISLSDRNCVPQRKKNTLFNRALSGKQQQ